MSVFTDITKMVAIALTLGLGVAAQASEHVGTLTQVGGSVKLLTHPSKKLQPGSGVHAQFEGQYYLVEDGKAGSELNPGDVIRTSPEGKARVIYPNGDQFHVGPGTEFKVLLPSTGAHAGVQGGQKTGPTDTKLELAYGQLRGVIEKGGPRSKLQIRTKTATMGVRGTDFFIEDGGATGGTAVSIIRGAVVLTPKASEAKPVEVKSGFSATVLAPPPHAAGATETLPVAELRKTSQEELKQIVVASTILAPSSTVPTGASAAAPTVLTSRLVELEKKAAQTTLSDIKLHDPKLFAQLEKSAAAAPGAGGLASVSAEAVNNTAVQALLPEAPKTSPARKVRRQEIEDLEQGAYDKYFKSGE
jgi:hypothetical protein